ncbi:MAG: carboxymuconolactone decarboxylase family protein [Methanotrichaceae archaeon]|nr:carboxymuconolactone decarboxylase family protein [Methanotrichaceae archaeon]
MTEETPRHFKSGKALGAGINSAFINLRTEIMKDGALSTKEKALIALASVVALQCDCCVEFHKEVAISAGAIREEILEAAAVGGLVRLGSGFASASMILEDAKK